MIELYVLEFDGLDIPADVLSKVSYDRATIIRNCVNSLKKKQLVLSELLVRRVVKSKLGITDEEIEFCKNEHGKPYIKDVLDFHFNLSHSEKMVVLAISDTPVGVDVEFIRKFNDRLMDKCFSLKEKEYVAHRSTAFFELWTKKEAYIKSLGNTFFTNSPKDIAVLEKPLADNFKKFESNGYIISIYKEKIEDVNVTVLKEADVY
jgi:4'-phosphopantetheinyl transferase